TFRVGKRPGACPPSGASQDEPGQRAARVLPGKGATTMKAVITGGSGLIGQALCRKLAGDKHQITILSRNADQVRGLPAGIEVVRWDGSSSNGWGHLVEGADAIINLAGSNLAD